MWIFPKLLKCGVCTKPSHLTFLSDLTNAFGGTGTNPNSDVPQFGERFSQKSGGSHHTNKNTLL